jgi:hypothetical protein
MSITIDHKILNRVLGLNVFVPGIVGVGLEYIVIYFPLKKCKFGRIATALISGRRPEISSKIASPPKFVDVTSKSTNKMTLRLNKYR